MEKNKRLNFMSRRLYWYLSFIDNVEYDGPFLFPFFLTIFRSYTSLWLPRYSLPVSLPQRSRGWPPTPCYTCSFSYSYQYLTLHDLFSLRYLDSTMNFFFLFFVTLFSLLPPFFFEKKYFIPVDACFSRRRWWVHYSFSPFPLVVTYVLHPFWRRLVP